MDRVEGWSATNPYRLKTPGLGEHRLLLSLLGQVLELRSQWTYLIGEVVNVVSICVSLEQQHQHKPSGR